MEHSESLLKSALDGLPSNIAIVDRDGIILLVNEAWRRFAAENGPVAANVCEGANYLRVCDDARGPDAEQAADFARALRDMLSGKRDELEMEYPCHSPDTERWFLLRASRFGEARSPKVIISHINTTKLKQAQKQIRASLREKEVLLREIHHRVKNNIQVIASLLNLQAGRIGDPRLLEAFKESQHRIRSMALVHESLYLSQNLSQVDAREYVAGLVRMLSGTYGLQSSNIEIRQEVENVTFNIDQAIPCGLILNELISNSLKHAFEPGKPGVLLIRLAESPDGWVSLTVEDNGRGLPKDLKAHSETHLGLSIVNGLAEQLKGKLEVESHGGARFSVRFPKKESLTVSR